MKLTGIQYQQLQSALLSAFDESGLRQLATFELNANLDHIAGGKDLTERVYNLVKWADEHSRVPELVSGALHQNSTNDDLKALASAIKNWRLEPPAEEPPADPLRGADHRPRTDDEEDLEGEETDEDPERDVRRRLGPGRQRDDPGHHPQDPDEREAIIGRVELGNTYEDLATNLGKPSANAARMAVARALVRLAEEMKRGRAR